MFPVVVVVVAEKVLGKFIRQLEMPPVSCARPRPKATSAVSQPASILINAGMIKCLSPSGRLQLTPL